MLPLVNKLFSPLLGSTLAQGNEMKFKKVALLLPFLFAASFNTSAATANPEVHWEYSGKHGPKYWGDLAPEFVQCKVGVNQSPVDISNTLKASLKPLTLNYTTSTINVVNNGHTAQVNVEPGNFLEVEGERFELIQFHLHAPSEHHINGKPFLMETHYVHKNNKGELAVVASLHNEGKFSTKLGHIEAAISAVVGREVPFMMPLEELGVVSGDKHYYRYNGSLTTPPCSEGVRWFVLKQPRPISKKQQALFVDLIGEDARGPQPINARRIVE
jgi:carbonic anhydrase